MKNKKKFLWGQFIRSVAVIAVPVALQNLLTQEAALKKVLPEAGD